MRLFIAALLFAAALVAPPGALAQTYKEPPSDGYWWNPAEGGRGWSIITQNDIVAVTHYGYATSGASLFLQSVAPWNSSTGGFSTALYAFSGGACFGCPLRQATDQNLGTVTFQFSNEYRGTVTYPDGTRIAIEKYDFGYPTTLDFMYGTWATAWYGVSGLSFDNLIYLNRSAGGTDRALGSLELSRAGRPVIFGKVSGQAYVAVIDSVPGFNDYYYAVMTSGKVEGLACTGASTSPVPSLTSCLGILYGYRAHDMAQSRLFFGASKTVQSDMVGETADRLEEMRAAVGAKAAHRIPDELLQHAEELQAAAEVARQKLQAERR